MKWSTIEADEVILSRGPNEPDLGFKGVLVAEASSEHAPWRTTGMWTEIRVWRTVGGSLVYEKLGTRGPDTPEHHLLREVGVVDNKYDLWKQLGLGSVQDSIYEQLDVVPTEWIQ